MVKADKKTNEKKVQKATVAKAARFVAPVPVTSKEILAKAQTESPVSNSAVEYNFLHIYKHDPTEGKAEKGDKALKKACTKVC
jgi:hypothetical protein